MVAPNASADVNHAAKRAAGEHAALMILDDVTVGVGTGSTVRWFIDALIERVAQGLICRAVATSEASAVRLRAGGIEVVTLGPEGVPIAVDGADMVDPDLRLIKGGGGAAVRERIVASAAQRFIVIVDDSKLSPSLHGRLPVELLSFGAAHTMVLLEQVVGAPFQLRCDAAGTPRLSDSGNLLADGLVDAIGDPEGLAADLDAVPGLVGHGLFLGMADQLLVGHSDGRVLERLPRHH